MTGTGLWIRIRHRFGPRMTEWVVAVQMSLWGLVLLLPADTFDGEAWLLFRSVMSENAWGALMLFFGLLRLGGLVVNGARKNVTPWIRIISAAFGFFVFVGISCCFALSGVVSTWIAIYPTIALVEIANMFRAAHDVGEGYGTPT